MRPETVGMIVLAGAATAVRASSPPPCTYRPGHTGESAAHYSGLREMPARAAAAGAPPATARTHRFAREPYRDPAQTYRKVDADGRATGRAMAGAELRIDWSSFDAARAAYELGLHHDAQR